MAVAFARCVFLSSIVVCAACGGHPGVGGKAFLLGETDHSGILVHVMRGSDVLASAWTNVDGSYRVEAPGGAYDLRFEHDGYQTAVQPDVVIGQNDVSVPETTLRRGALVAPAPIVSAQPLGSTKALVQFGDGFDSPSYVLDLASGKTKQIAAGTVTVLAAKEDFATVRVGGLQRLDLSTAALAPVEPSEGDSQRGFAAGDYYVYAGLDGKLNVLATGAVTAVSFDTFACVGFGPLPGSASADTPGWLTVRGFQRCDAPSPLQTLVNPALHAMSGAFSTVFARSRNAFLLEPASPANFNSPATLRKLDLVTGAETTVKDVVTGTNVTDDGNSVLVTQRAGSSVRDNYSFVDLATAGVRDVAFDASVTGAFRTETSNLAALLVTSAAGATMIRIDKGTATSICNGGAFPVFIKGNAGLAIVCSSGGTIVAYEWATDSARTLSTSATSSPALFGRVLTWNEGATTRGVRLGSGDPPLTLCSTSTLIPSSTSADGEVATVFCPDGADPRWLAVDLRTGVSQTLLARTPGSTATINAGNISLSPRGRGALILYSTDAAPGDPLDCGASSCIQVVDILSGATALRPNLSFPSISASPDDRGFLIGGSFPGSSQVVTFGAGAPTFASVPPARQIYGIGPTGRAALLLSAASFPPLPVIVDLASGTTTSVSFLDGSSPVPLGSDGDFVISQGVAHLDTGTIDTFAAGWSPLCNRLRDPLLFFDPSGTTLQEYGPGSGVRTVAQGLRSAQGSCFDSFELFLATEDGIRGTLLRYATDTGTLTEAAQDVSAKTSGSLSDRFAFQHPDLVSGDLLLLPSDGGPVRPLRARAHLGSQFIEAGKRVAFTGGAADGQPKLMVANLDGSGARTVGPAADLVNFSAGGEHLIFQARGLSWAEAPTGPAVALDEQDRTGKVVISGSGQYVLYSVVTGERRGTYRVDLGPSCTASLASCTASAAVF